MCWALNCEIPVCSRRFVWRMGWSAAWLNRSGNARRSSEGSGRFIHPSIFPVDARQAYCSILRPALISSLYAFNHVRECVGGLLGELVGVHERWWCWWWWRKPSFFFSPPSAPSLGNSLPSLPASLPRRPLLMIYGCNGRGPQEASGQSGLGGGARQGRKPGCLADWLTEWQVGLKIFKGSTGRVVR